MKIFSFHNTCVTGRNATSTTRAHFPRVGKHRGEEKTAASTVSGVLELLFSDIVGKMDRVHLIPMSQGDFKNLTQQHPVLFKESVQLQVGISDLLGASPRLSSLPISASVQKWNLTQAFHGACLPCLSPLLSDHKEARPVKLLTQKFQSDQKMPFVLLSLLRRLDHKPRRSSKKVI